MRTESTILPEVRFSGRFVRANDHTRNVLLTMAMITVWLAGFVLWIVVWRYGRWLGGIEGGIIRFCGFCAGGFHAVSMDIIRDWSDRGLSSLGR